jgi:hypothetical protein
MKRSARVHATHHAANCIAELASCCPSMYIACCPSIHISCFPSVHNCAPNTFHSYVEQRRGAHDFTHSRAHYIAVLAHLHGSVNFFGRTMERPTSPGCKLLQPLKQICSPKPSSCHFTIAKVKFCNTNTAPLRTTDTIGHRNSKAVFPRCGDVRTAWQCLIVCDECRNHVLFSEGASRLRTRFC